MPALFSTGSLTHAILLQYFHVTSQSEMVDDKELVCKNLYLKENGFGNMLISD
jgi:hypothetical protein